MSGRDGAPRDQPAGSGTPARTLTLQTGARHRPARRRGPQRIGALSGLPALSLDALSSVAYGPEAMMVVLVAGGAPALRLLGPLTIAIVVLLAVLVVSYRQVIAAYPDGGGAYAVSKANLGDRPSRIAAASLVVDYVLNVAVSLTAGAAALVSAFPSLAPFTVPLCLALLAALTAVNLFGIGASARALLAPTLIFIGGIYLVIATGLLRAHAVSGALPPAPRLPSAGTIGILLILKAFSAGSSALTGVEAIANGVPGFKEPRVRRAQTTELLLGGVLGSMLLGLAVLALRFHIAPRPHDTVLAQIIADSVGHNAVYYVVSLSVTTVLALAANTSFGGLPVLASLLARDNLMPHVFGLRGERPVYRYGVVVLAVLAAALIVGSGGNVNALIPLFAIGVFTGFTLSQAGLVRHWHRTRPPGWWRRASVNAAGAVLTGAATIIFVLTKFLAGAWIVLLAIPLMVVLFDRIRRYYRTLGDVLGLGVTPAQPHPQPHLVIVPVLGINRLTERALAEALALGGEVRACTVIADADDDTTGKTSGDDAAAKATREWQQWNPHVPLDVLRSPDHAVVRPLVDYISGLEADHRRVVVVLGELDPRKFRHELLQNQRGRLIAASLHRHTGAVVATLRYHLDD